MATATLYRTIELLPVGGSITLMTPSQIQAALGPLTVNFYGSFDFAAGVAGTISAMDVRDTSTGEPYYVVTGLAHDAALYFHYLAFYPYEWAEGYLFNGDDILFGSAEGDYLPGYSGADSILGGVGDDVIDGGSDTASDTLDGGPGDDVYLGVTAADVLQEGPEQGTDLVFANATFTLPPHFEHLALAGDGAGNLYGNELDNLLAGNTASNVLEGYAGADTLDGGGGWSDTLTGGTGNDEYFVDSGAVFVVEQPGEGVDTIRTSISRGLSDHVENLVLTGSASIQGSGNSLANVLTGNGGDNLLAGWEGNDTLAGGGGTDTLQGDTGVDTALMGGPVSQLQGYYFDGSWHALMPGASIELLMVERVCFDDALFALDTRPWQVVWNVEAVFWAGFNRAPDWGELSSWVHVADGLPWIEDLAAAMLQYYAPAIRPEELVTHLFWTVLGYGPTPAELDALSSQIGPGLGWEDNADFLASYATRPENRAHLVGVEDGIVALDPSYF